MQTTIFQDEILKQWVAEFTGNPGPHMECVNDDCPFVRQPRRREPSELVCGFCKTPLVPSSNDGTP